MERAVDTTSKLGFMLRDLHYEFASRFVDELPIQDKRIGERNAHFKNYSLFGRIYLVLLIIIKEAIATETTATAGPSSVTIEAILSRKAIYDRLRPFRKEISALKLTSSARTCLEKFKMTIKHAVFTT